jgi:apolipoprotein N-acyltransferase
MQLGYALADVPVLAQAADLGSVPLLSFVVILVDASLAEMWAAGPRPVPWRVAVARPSPWPPCRRTARIA